MRAVLGFSWKLGKWAGAAVVVAYIAVCTVMYVMQRSLVFPKLAGHVTAVEAGFPEAQEVALHTSDGERLVAWYVPPKSDKPLFIYFHGNGDTLNWRVGRDRKLVADGSGLLAVSYRGYEGSTGSPSEDGMHLDAAAAYAFAADHQIGPDRIVLWGQSLGTGVAVWLAVERKIKALVLESPYTSVADVAAMNYPLLPVRWLLKDQFHSDWLISKVTAPVLVFHGAKDETVPISFGQRLYNLVKAPKCFVRFPLGGHDDLDDVKIVASIRGFIARSWRGSAEPAGDGCQRASLAS
ncbi:alpha/beta hydrolase [Bradyrhizobium sp.]|uniref:alpha/beta hydrolase n=1 Tax=Bradyrhizobium sp. TaxID=376 RepID=UPI00238F5A60|nr:alpha/beta hydrolase [Bradyrhizobium sp.]MDE1936372.1 alpha/beta hydrolase [Bradyrhizobium sp.]